jgi:hypothetical protein
MTVVRPAPFRLARGTTVAAVGCALAVTAHVAAGGSAGSALPALLPAALVLVGCLVAAQRAWTMGRLLLALVATQAVVHGSLWLTSGTHEVDSRLAGLATTQVAHAHGTSTAGPAMLAAHAVAVLVAAFLLSGVDDAVLTIWRLGRAVLGVRPSAVSLPGRPALVTSTATRTLPRSRALLVSPRRGPPAVPAPA